MKFRFTYSATGFAPFVANDPSGWDSASIGFERDPKLLSLIEFFKSSFFSYGSNGEQDGGRDYLLSVEAANGSDSLITVLIEIDNLDSGNYETFYSGTIAVDELIESLSNSHILTIVFNRSDYWTKFIKRFNSQVDLKSVVDLDGNAVASTPSFTLPLPSQIIPKSYSAFRDNNTLFLTPGPPGNKWIFLVGFDKELTNEITYKSNISFDISVSDVRVGAISPQDLSVPFFNFTDDGVLNIQKLKFTLSEGYPPDDPAYNAGGFTQTKSTKLKAMDFGDATMNFFLQKNNEAPIPFSKVNRNVANTFNRNVDGALVTNANIQVTDYTFTPQQILCKKGDFIRIFGIRTDPDNYVWYWGKSGWSHDDALNSIIYSQGATEGPGGSFLNEGHISFGGYFDASLNTFPITIDDDAGMGQAIQSGNFWLIAKPGVLGGVPVDETMVLTAKVNNPGNVIGDWYITTKSYYEGLEAYGMADNGFDCRFDTTFKDSSCDAFLTHNVAKGIIDRIAGAGLFQSNYFGNPYTSPVYGAVGCGSNLAQMLGLHLRGYSIATKPMQKSMQDWFDELNPLHCLGIGDEGGKIICERAEHFFDDSNVSVQFMNIADIKRSYDKNFQFNQVKFGHDKWQSQAATGVGSPSGIDDAQTQRTWTNGLKTIGKPIEFLSKMVMAALNIETTRRATIATSANYTYDNDTFGIALHDNGGGTYVPQTNQDFTIINNLLNSDTRYNSSYTPARSFLRWSKYLFGCVQDYIGSFFNFAGGVGNFLMNSTKNTSCEGDDNGINVAENGNFVITNDFLFLPTPLTINHYIDWPTYKYLRDHKNWSIQISQTETNFVKCFVWSLEYKKVEGKLSMVVLPKSKFTIQRIESIAVGEGQIPGIKYFQIPEFADEFE